MARIDWREAFSLIILLVLLVGYRHLSLQTFPSHNSVI